ncbi:MULTISPECIES: GDP-mannose mannosyl hydrolase [unclassified Halorubrum]|uniref:GDP-mannose mannosyl hydrolase n=1 Tax=unclassified Halorubrum TaxID=2642239 RepID=UPI0010FA24C2|nr:MULTISPECIES: NUDIX domain-containing protein [unclassified Halorubrum]TKX46011.1 NUDIX domain-containing protein [Halorubrum sp. ARQ200]TKX50167.1 NUDIX domain-containing protein [Halorubrum sp. ASP121]
MTNFVERIPDDVWAEVVKHMPIPSVDLVVRCADGILLAKRQNEPAKGEWFVPGGRVRKGEPLSEAVERVAQEELGVGVSIEERLGAYDHLYDTSDVDESGGKHYVANGFLVTPETEAFALDGQHSDFSIFAVDSLPDLHPYVEAYLRAASIDPDSVNRSPYE